MRTSAAPLLLLALWAPSAAADDGAGQEAPVPDGRHLLELGYTSIDGFDGDIYVLVPKYTYSYSQSLRFSFGTQLVEVQQPAATDSGGSSDQTGLGDSFVLVQYDPGEQLTSNPWIPNTLGLFGAALFPTADDSEGLGLDTWGAAVGVGWPILLSESFMAVPTAAYTRTFYGGDDGITLDQLGLGVSLIWVLPLSTWLGIEPSYNWDFDLDTSDENYQLVAGKFFSNGLAVDLQWGLQRRYEKYATRDDEILLLNISWQFGAPPR